MKKAIYLSLACTLAVYATPTQLATVTVETKVDTEMITDVHAEDIKSADLGEALFKESASISLVRRSGIANDVILRGQKKDNVNITIDGTKVFGACPNRMDPPVSHVLSNNIDYVVINEGPYNVEDTGALSGDVAIHTIKPKEGLSGELDVGLGSWGYKKGAFELQGGTQRVRFLLSGSTETSGQYKDGNGDDFVGQIDRNIANGASPMVQYQDQYKDLDAYSKQTLMAKLFWDITENQSLQLSYTANRSDDVLYPSSPMDALYDDSDIYNLEYTLKRLGAYSKELSVQLYQSEVDHPMSTLYRKSSMMDSNPDMDGVQAVEKTHALTTKMQGAKLKNSFDMQNHTITTGLDYSLRNWDGQMFMNGMPGMRTIWDVDTKNTGLFVEDKIALNPFELSLGLRYDDTQISSGNPAQPSNDYTQLNGFVYGTYSANASTKYFAGLGKSSRVPDGRELYMMMNGVGNPNLNDTVNYEIDLGAQKQYANAMVKAKVFYSMLSDFIVYNSTVNSFENTDASIYGFEVSGSYILTEKLYFDYGMAYQRGEKDAPLVGQNDTDLPEIPPFKLNVAANYEYDATMKFQAELVASDKWSDFDADNGEQAIDAYGVLNLKGSKRWGAFELTVGVDNLFDSAYAVSNTYKDLTLVTSMATGEVMLMNEPGRYFYTNLKYQF